MLRLPRTGLATPAVAGRGLSEGLGLTVLRPLLVKLDLKDQLRLAMRNSGI